MPGETGPVNRKKKGWELRDYLISLATTKNTVTFLDGARYPGNNDYSTHYVIVEFPRYAGIRLNRNKGTQEGTAEVVLRSVAP